MHKLVQYGDGYLGLEQGGQGGARLDGLLVGVLHHAGVLVEGPAGHGAHARLLRQQPLTQRLRRALLGARVRALTGLQVACLVQREFDCKMKGGMKCTGKSGSGAGPKGGTQELTKLVNGSQFYPHFLHPLR